MNANRYSTKGRNSSRRIEEDETKPSQALRWKMPNERGFASRD